ncbi:Noelin-3 [Orchesella cincta]|uniref:Noelin-3 n=1 Tax=Orchesella cincta TaxID=48709 RepID=A0A1D2MU84_ORCCI|nr:Noelin-3 [Orchesella cincta]
MKFPPMIRIQNQMIGASIGSKGMFDCYIEAFPPSVTYWERSDGRVLEGSEKYQVGIKELGSYKVHMMLNVSRVSISDMGRYHCVSKNELGITKGDFTLYEVDPNLVTPPPKSVGGKGVAIYGQIQPEHVDLDDLCPSAPPCPECPPRIDPAGRCRSGGFALLDMVGWEIYPLGNLTSPKPTNRTQDCVLSAVGKPVFNRYSANPAGCWMREPVQSGASGEKYWVTKTEDPNHLFEYSNRTAFVKGQSTRNFTLPFPLKGNFHTIFNGSFFYVTDAKEGNPKIVRLDLFTGKTMGDLELPYASFSAEKLYSSEFSWVDLNVDENGLWAVHSLVGSNNTAIVKIHADLEGMEILYGWNVTISHVYAGDMFVICGVI